MEYRIQQMWEYVYIMKDLTQRLHRLSELQYHYVCLTRSQLSEFVLQIEIEVIKKWQVLSGGKSTQVFFSTQFHKNVH